MNAAQMGQTQVLVQRFLQRMEVLSTTVKHVVGFECLVGGCIEANKAKGTKKPSTKQKRNEHEEL